MVANVSRVCRKEETPALTEEAPKIDEPAPVAPLAVEEPKPTEEAKPAPVPAAA